MFYFILDFVKNLNFMLQVFSFDKAWSSKQSSCQLAKMNAQSKRKKMEAENPNFWRSLV